MEQFKPNEKKHSKNTDKLAAALAGGIIGAGIGNATADSITAAFGETGSSYERHQPAPKELTIEELVQEAKESAQIPVPTGLKASMSELEVKPLLDEQNTGSISKTGNEKATDSYSNQDEYSDLRSPTPQPLEQIIDKPIFVKKLTEIYGVDAEIVYKQLQDQSTNTYKLYRDILATISSRLDMNEYNFQKSADKYAMFVFGSESAFKEDAINRQNLSGNKVAVGLAQTILNDDSSHGNDGSVAMMTQSALRLIESAGITADTQWIEELRNNPEQIKDATPQQLAILIFSRTYFSTKNTDHWFKKWDSASEEEQAISFAALYEMGHHRTTSGSNSTQKIIDIVESGYAANNIKRNLGYLFEKNPFS